MNFMELLNAVAKVAKPAHRDFRQLQEMGEKFEDADLDSLDMMMVIMYMAMIYGIADDDTKDFHPVTPEELLEFINKHKTKDPESLEQAIKEIK